MKESIEEEIIVEATADAISQFSSLEGLSRGSKDFEQLASETEGWKSVNVVLVI